MKKILLTFIIAFTYQSYAQMAKNVLPKNGFITGKVIDNATKEPIIYASIIIKDDQQKTITGGITDDKGAFKITKIPEGTYTLEVQFMGYKTKSVPFTISSQKTRINLGTVLVDEDAQSLESVEVRAEISTTVQKVDRKVINIGKDLVSSGATVSEIMNNIPSVSVDQNGAISLRGNSNVRVLIDGKPSTIDAATLLKQIPSTSIKSVELITNPSAKYNPEGMSGIINIVLKKNANMGFNGSVNTGLTYGEDPKFNGSINMNYKTGKINFFTNYGFNGGTWNNHGFVNRFDNNLEQDFKFNSKNNSHLIKFGFDIYINKKNTLSFYTNQNISNNDGDNRTDVNFLADNVNDLIQKSNSESKNNTQTYNVDYKLDFAKEGHNIEFEINQSISKPKEDTEFTELNNPGNQILNYIDDIDNKRNNTIFNVDYVNPLNDKSKLEIGAESRIRRTDNNRITSQLTIDLGGNIVPTPDTFYEYDQDIHSFYMTYSRKFDKFTAQVGARLESYNVKADLNNSNIFKDDYITVYPSAFFTYSPSKKNQYQLSYSRRVDRPNFNQVNPIREWSTPQITSVGNPELKPQFTNSIEINYTRQLKKGSVTIGTFYRNIIDNINRSIDIDPLDVNKVLLSYINTDNNNAYGIEISSNYRLKKWWSINASFDLYSQNERGPINGSNVEITNTSYNFRANNNFKATKNLSFTLFGMYRGANQNLQFDVDPMYKIDVGARLRILKGKGSISLRFNDVFDTMHFGFESERPFSQKGEFFWESQTVYVGFNYRFGGGKNKSRQRKRRDNHEKRGGAGF
jgi:outer membrane receptor protein involved in Fe transport